MLERREGDDKVRDPPMGIHLCPAILAHHVDADFSWKEHPF
jgi:hypothetical protein